MDDIRLPRHAINRLEHRWANRLKQDAKAWSGEKNRAVRSRQVQSYGPRGIPVTVRRARRTSSDTRDCHSSSVK